MLEAGVKEAMYALDETNPLRFYNCLTPEITAFRKIRPADMSKKMREKNYVAKMELVDKQIKLKDHKEKMIRKKFYVANRLVKKYEE